MDFEKFSKVLKEKYTASREPKKNDKMKARLKKKRREDFSKKMKKKPYEEQSIAEKINFGGRFE